MSIYFNLYFCYLKIANNISFHKKRPQNHQLHIFTILYWWGCLFVKCMYVQRNKNKQLEDVRNKTENNERNLKKNDGFFLISQLSYGLRLLSQKRKFTHIRTLINAVETMATQLYYCYILLLVDIHKKTGEKLFLEKCILKTKDLF